MKIRRREFLGAAAGAGMAAMGMPLFAGEEKASTAAKRSDWLDPVAVVPLGKELKVTRIGLGTGVKSWNRTSAQIKLGQKHFDGIFRHAYDQGVRLFDLADLYGSHSYAARNLKNKPRESYALVSKIWLLDGGVPDAEKGDADKVVARFLKELGTDYIDLVQLHCMTSPTWPSEMRRQMDLLDGLKQKGLIRAHGCSCHSLAALEAAAAEPWVDVVHARINPFQLRTDGTAETVLAIVKKLHAAGKGVVGMKIIGEGELKDDSEKIDQSVQFAVDSGAVDVMVVGFEQTWQIDDFKERVKRALERKAKSRAAA